MPPPSLPKKPLMLRILFRKGCVSWISISIFVSRKSKITRKLRKNYVVLYVMEVYSTSPSAWRRPGNYCLIKERQLCLDGKKTWQVLPCQEKTTLPGRVEAVKYASVAESILYWKYIIVCSVCSIHRLALANIAC